MHRRTSLLLGAAVLLLIGGVVAGYRMLTAGSGPQAVVRAYFDALAARDGLAATAQ
ncbi:MAG TPA: hypothetical protein VF062_12385 [Candidatus Limnocylindrales bacterium]